MRAKYPEWVRRGQKVKISFVDDGARKLRQEIEPRHVDVLVDGRKGRIEKVIELRDGSAMMKQYPSGILVSVHLQGMSGRLAFDGEDLEPLKEGE